jgi:hypothetical protein
MKKLLLFLLLIFLNLSCFARDQDSTTSSNSPHNSFRKKMVISVPVTDLRKEPTPNIPNMPYPIYFKDNPQQDSQLLMGEYVIAINEKRNLLTGKSWLKVLALEQPTLENSNWIYKEGWINKNHAKEVNEFPSYNIVIKKQWANIFAEATTNSKIIAYFSIGTKLTGQRVQNSNWYRVFLDENFGFVEKSEAYYITSGITETEKSLRKKICKRAASFLNTPYSWGGRSGYNRVINDNVSTSPLGVDCSGFINLVYRSTGLDIPRDSHDQFGKSNKIKTGKELKPGDLVFFAKIDNPNKIVHVGMFYIAEFFGPVLQESSISEWSHLNCMVPVKIKLGREIETIKSGEPCGNYVIYFGSFLNDIQLIKELRETSLKNYFLEFKNFTQNTNSLKITSTQK